MRGPLVKENEVINIKALGLHGLQPKEVAEICKRNVSTVNDVNRGAYEHLLTSTNAITWGGVVSWRHKTLTPIEEQSTYEQTTNPCDQDDITGYQDIWDAVAGINKGFYFLAREIEALKNNNEREGRDEG